MFGLGWAEIMVAAVVGLIVIGPKELPVVFRKIGQFVGKAKGMARDFSRAMNDAADDSGMKEAMESMHSLKDGVSSVTDPVSKWKDIVPGSETAKLSEKRAKTLKKKNDAIAVKPQEGLDAVKTANAASETYTSSANVEKLSLKNPAVKKSVMTNASAKPTVARKTLAGSKKVAAKKNNVNHKAPKPGKTQ